VELTPDTTFPDSTFVEDAAVLTPEAAILTRPGAPSRMGEVDAIREILTRFYHRMYAIQAPGTLDGGDICEAGQHFFIGISERTNVAGAVQLAEILAKEGYSTDLVDIRTTPGILHLKSGIAYLGDRTLALIGALADNPVFRDYQQLRVLPGEEYAANCVRVNDFVLTAAGFPGMQKALENSGFQPLPLEMSEFQKMDGGLSCLSLRF
jgi:dimethylargininase